jgi:hypothetical protein
MVTNAWLTLTDKFRKGLKEVIDSFERAKEWADLSNCLQKVKKQFDQNQGVEIPMKKDLAKRLGKALEVIMDCSPVFEP